MKPFFAIFTTFIVVTLIGFQAGSVSAQSTTPESGEPTPIANALPTGVATGKITNQNNPDVPVSDLEVMLHILDQDQNQLGMLHGQSAADGSFVIKDVPMAPGIGYAAAVVFDETTYYSPIVWAESGSTTAVLDVPVYESTPDLTDVRIELMHVLFNFAQDGIEVKELIALTNLGDRTVRAGQEIPGNSEVKAAVLFPLPKDADFISFEPQDNTRFIKYSGGFADLAPIQPGEMGSMLVANFLIPYGDPRTFTYQTSLPVNRVNLLLPHASGITLKADGIGTAEKVEGRDGTLYDLYPIENLAAGTELVINLEGEVNLTTEGNTAPAEGSVANNQLPWIIGAAVLGIALAGGGVFWWARSNKPPLETGDQEIEGGSRALDSVDPDLDELLEAINRLDQRFEAGEMDEQQYHSLRSELTAQAKAILPEG